MRFVILILAWVTPAALAAAFGWRGIWGSGNVFVEFLIPIPVAGGVFHVPSFALAAAVIFSSHKLPASVARLLPVLAFAVLIAMLSLSLEFDRLNAWLFTNYEPYGSPFRLDGNLLFLFVATDAFWVGTYALFSGYTAPLRHWSILPVVPIAVIAISAISYKSDGPIFQVGGAYPGNSRGDETRVVYTSAPYDEVTFMNWVINSDSALPWNNINTEHVAIVFTENMDAMKWGRFEEIKNEGAVATFCLYEEAAHEEDRLIDSHSGYYDCFADRNTAEEDLAALLAEESTGLGRDIDVWYASVRFCDNIDITANVNQDIARPGICHGVRNVFPTRIRTFIQKYGEDSDQVAFVKMQADSRGMEE